MARSASRAHIVSSVIAVASLLLGAALVAAWEPKTVKDDPLVRHPGTQPADGVVLEGPNRCLNCHAGYNTSTEPGFNWQGSMMAQAQRDFLYLSCLTVAAQDSIWAIGRPNATDICIRCHTPPGWLGGRSDPTNASLLTGSDHDGVSCDFCHRMYDPFYETTFDGSREGDDWLGYWDETNASGTSSQVEADTTFFADEEEALTVRLFNGEPFYPLRSAYTEAASGQYYVSSGSQKRASFADAEARHQMLYSRFHKSKYFCAACHDVSNPVLANLADADVPPGDGETVLTTEASSAHGYFHVERTFSEFILSAYGAPGGAAGLGPFAPTLFETSLANNYIARCQDCHMRDVIGYGANKRGIPLRPDDSIEHPQSGLPLHDLTGGNAWVPWILASTVSGSPNYDATNDSLLNQAPEVLTLDLSAGLGLNPEALLAAVDRAKQQLELAAAINELAYDPATGALSFRVQNQSGHKLISGFPEGRRMFANVRLYASGSLVYEINPYDVAAGTLKGVPGATYYDPDPDPETTLPPPADLTASELYVDELVYEMHPSSSLTGEAETFHFALGDGRYKDNRIPPQGFRIAEAADRVSVPVWHGVEDPSYFTAAEYSGGYDEVSLVVPAGADAVEVELYYQTTSREYIEFLRDEIEATPGRTTLSSPTPSGEPQAYIVQTDPWFDQLRAWGATLWQLWKHNMYVDGSAPIEMAEASWGSGGGDCEAPTPTLLSADGGHNQVTLEWSNEHAGEESVVGYRVYYDQADKGQFIDQVALVTSYTDLGLTDGQQYCYKLTTLTEECESDFSNVLCATPAAGSTGIGVDSMETGYWAGKGKNRTWTPTSSFSAGRTVIFRMQILDQAGDPVANAVATLAITGPESTTVTSGMSDGDGWTEATWSTKARRKNGSGGTPPGSYTARTTSVAADGYTWNELPTEVVFQIE